MGKIIKAIKNPKKILIYLASKGIIKYDDRKYLEYEYYEKMGKKLNLDNPQKYSEKLQWLKLYDHNPLYTKMVDKYESKSYVKEKVGEQYIVKTYGIYDNFDEIDFNKLPNKFIMKCTHDSGGTFICKDKMNFNYKKAKKVIKKCLKRKYFYLHREWPYKNVKPRIIIEELLENKNSKDLLEYNFFMFNGKPEFFMLCYGDKRTNRYNDYYDMDCKRLNIKLDYMTSDNNITKPKNFDKMVEISKKLSANIPSLRVDLYVCNNKIYVGELTFFHWAGFTNFEPQKYDLYYGKKLDITGIKNK